jgi:hypothetical protein
MNNLGLGVRKVNQVSLLETQEFQVVSSLGHHGLVHGLYGFEFEDSLTIDDDIRSEITYGVPPENDGYDSFRLVWYTVFTEDNFHGVVIDTLTVAWTESVVDFIHEFVNHITIV